MPSAKRKVVLASRNEDKLRELSELCVGLPFTVVSALDYDGLPDVIEDGTTALDNAARKAIVTAAFTGEIAIADDTTLQVDVLGGLPDVFAARFAGPDATYADNSALLLELLAGVPDGNRQARFETAAVWIDPRPGRSAAEQEGRLVAPAQQGWLRNPFARSVAALGGADPPEFGYGLADHRRAWDQYRNEHQGLYAESGIDPERVRAVLDGLIAPCLAEAEPLASVTAAEGAAGAAIGGGAAGGATLDGAASDGDEVPPIRLLDTRIWSVGGPDDAMPLAPAITATGLPATAPGRSRNEPIWRELSAEGRVLGTITRQPLGGGGFGYDPIFRPEGYDRTLAEMSSEEKNAISHRGRALRRLITAVGQTYPAG